MCKFWVQQSDVSLNSSSSKDLGLSLEEYIHELDGPSIFRQDGDIFSRLL